MMCLFKIINYYNMYYYNNMDAVGGRCQIVSRATFGKCPLESASRFRNKSCLRPTFACATPRIFWSFLRAAHRCVVHVCFCCLLWHSVSTNASLVVVPCYRHVNFFSLRFIRDFLFSFSYSSFRL